MSTSHRGLPIHEYCVAKAITQVSYMHHSVQMHLHDVGILKFNSIDMNTCRRITIVTVAAGQPTLVLSCTHFGVGV